jgi:restriction system protein
VATRCCRVQSEAEAQQIGSTINASSRFRFLQEDGGVTTKKSSGSQFAKYMGPTIDALRDLGGSGRPEEVRELVAQKLGISDEEQSKPLPSGVQTRFENQVHWARFYLAKAGYIDSSQRGVWTLTEKGRALGKVTLEKVRQIVTEVSAQTKPRPGQDVVPVPETEEVDAQTTGNYREEVSAKLHSLPPAGFERFCQRLLRESGFQEVTAA